MRSFDLFIIFLPVIFAIISPGEGYRILGVFPFPGKSHFMMFRELMKELARRGHTVDVVSFFPLKEPFPNYNDIVILKREDDTTLQNNMTLEFARSITESSVARMIAVDFGGECCDYMGHPDLKKIIKNPPKDPPYDLLVAEIFGANCYLALGHHLKIPIVAVTTCAPFPWVNDMVANPDNPAYIPDVLSFFEERMNFWERVQNSLNIMRRKWEFNYYSAYQDEKIKKYLGSDALSLREAERNVSLILANSHYSIQGVRPYTTAIVEVAGLHIPETVKPLPNHLEKWLNESTDGFAYVSFGSMVKIESFPKEIIIAMYSSFAKLAPMRVLMKIANREELPPGLPNNILTLPWIPQLAVLKHKNARVFVTHGGLMGTQESIYCGVPMIGMPLFGDQMLNINRYVRKKIAVQLNYEDLTEEKLDEAFKTVLGDPSYRKAVKKLSAEFRDRPMTPMQTATFWVEYVIRNGGSPLRSVAMDLTWWQIHLLDVCGAILLSIILIIYFAVLIIKKIVAFATKRYTETTVNHFKKVK